MVFGAQATSTALDLDHCAAVPWSCSAYIGDKCLLTMDLPSAAEQHEIRLFLSRPGSLILQLGSSPLLSSAWGPKATRTPPAPEPVF